MNNDRQLAGWCGRSDVNIALARGMGLDAAARDFMSPCTVTLTPNRALQNAALDYLRSGVDAVPVLDDENRLVGTFALVEAVHILFSRQANTKTYAQQSR